MSATPQTWFTSSYSGSDGGQCVEVAHHTDTVRVRDSKTDRAEGTAALMISPAGWVAFIGWVRQG
ncbi:DUF397 domain-containing protein [Streptomyces sp. NPDC097619]|uniref:DUF397 domain-containing protein n=1 Tax=Streptomyces sp. NPDC097619 TaxID=3157228 RepID=UPI003329D147